MSIISTQIFYIVIMVLSIFFAFCSQKSYKIALQNGHNEYKEIKIRNSLYIVSFIIPCIVIAFTDIGSDYENYYMIIERLTWNNYDSFFSEEPAMNLLFLVIRTIAINNVDITIFIIKIITCMLFFISFYIASKEIKIGYAITGYLLLLFLPSFYLLTISLSASVVSVGMSLFFFKKKNVLPFLLILFAAQLHNSAYIFIPVYLACIFINGKRTTNIKRILFATIYIVMTLSASIIYSYIQKTVSGFHYNNYGTNSFNGSGLMIFVQYIPLFIILIYIFRMNNIDKNIKNYIFVFVLSDCLFYVLSYQFRVIERMVFYMVSLYTLLFPYVFMKISRQKRSNQRLVFTILELSLILYVCFRGYLVFIQRTTISSGVGHYHFFNPFA